MKTYCLIIEPTSPFGTPLKGDTLFGQFCWQAAYDETLLSIPFADTIAAYGHSPFAVFSSAFPALGTAQIALPRPQVPLETLFDLSGMNREDRVGERKQLKKRRWLCAELNKPLAPLHQCSYLTDADLAAQWQTGSDTEEISVEFLHSHNSINRLTGTTGEGFAPFSSSVNWYAPHGRLALVVGIDPAVLSVDALLKGVRSIGTLGFGRDASTGNGRFLVKECTEVNLGRMAAASPNALFTLGPCMPDMSLYRDAMFVPFTRFGRHGDHLATRGKPFKAPVIMADEGALFLPREEKCLPDRPYVGKALHGLSKVQETTVGQGYSLYIPVQMEAAR